MAETVDALNSQGFYGSAQPSTPGTAPMSFRQWCEELLEPAVQA
ncbi:hypothetical protein ACFWBB_14795 [Streptomyces sp. NPDC060000]